MADDAEHGRRLIECRRRPLGHQVENRTGQRQHEVADQRDEHRGERQVPQQRHQAVAPLEQALATPHRDSPPPARRGVGVEDDGIGDHPDSVARRVHPPAEVHVLAEQRHAGIEARHLLPDVAPDEHAGAGYGQHVPVAVVLPLVDLARLDAGDPAPGRVDGLPRLDDHVPVGPVHQLRPEHRRSRGLGGPAQQLLKRIGSGFAVIVQKPEPLDLISVPAAGLATGHRQACGLVLDRPPHGRRVAGGPVHPEDSGLPEQRRQHRAAAVAAAGIHGDHALHWLGLLVDRFHQMRKPRGAVVRDDHGGHHMLGIRVGWRQEIRLLSGG